MKLYEINVLITYQLDNKLHWKKIDWFLGEEVIDFT